MDSSDSVEIVPRRKASRSCQGYKHYLPNWVSKWTRRHIEKVLHVYYENQYAGPPQKIIDKIPQMTAQSRQQEEYISILKKPNFIPFLNNELLHVNHEEAKNRLSLSRQEVKNKFPLLETILSHENKAFLYTWICQYIAQLEKLIDRKINKRHHTRDRTFQPALVCENSYNKVVSAFATMCGLDVEEGDKGNRSVWKQLRGMNKTVVAEPNLRFYCTGEDFSAKDSLLTVTEVKNKGWHSEEYKLKRKYGEDSSKEGKRRRHEVSSSSSSSTSSLSDQSFSTSESPSIEYDVCEHTLGQHAGELLLDLHTYMEQYKGERTPSVLFMPGMIVDKTMVYFTILEISYQHYLKLAGADHLPNEERATIYYSHPKDLLDEHTIPILIDTFVRLNDMESVIEFKD